MVLEILVFYVAAFANGRRYMDGFPSDARLYVQA
jgi:hypothetical protein